MKKFFIILTLIFTLCINSVYACEVNEKCGNKGHADTSRAYSECYSSWSKAVDDAVDVLISRSNGSLVLADYPYYTVFTREYDNGNGTTHIRYDVYYSTEAWYYKSSTGDYVTTSDFIRSEAMPPLAKGSCENAWYAWSGAGSGGKTLSSNYYTFYYSNYDMLDSSGNAVTGTFDFGGSVEITDPAHNEDGTCVIVGLNTGIEFSAYYEYANLFTSPAVFEPFGTSTYEFIDYTINYSEDNGLCYGTYIFTVDLEYGVPTEVGIGFYDDFNQYHEDKLYVTVYENTSDVPEGVVVTDYNRVHGGTGGSLDDDTDSSGSGSSGGSSSGSSSSVGNFFSNLKNIFIDFDDFFSECGRFFGSYFSYLPSEISLFFGVGIIFVLILRILGR